MFGIKTPNYLLVLRKPFTVCKKKKKKKENKESDRCALLHKYINKAKAKVERRRANCSTTG